MQGCSDVFFYGPDGQLHPLGKMVGDLRRATVAMESLSDEVCSAADAAGGFSIHMEMPVDRQALRAWWRLDPNFVRWERLRFQMHRKGRPGWRHIR